MLTDITVSLATSQLKAVRMVHPDKQGPDVEVRQRVLAQKLFAVIQDAWVKFQKEQQ